MSNLAGSTNYDSHSPFPHRSTSPSPLALVDAPTPPFAPPPRSQPHSTPGAPRQILIFTLIFLEFLTYLLVRQLVNLFEYFSGFSSPARRRLRRALRSAASYEEWTAAALALDRHLGLDKWKKEAKYAYYDHALVRRVLRTLKDLCAKADGEGVGAVLYAALRTNFAGIESFRLYSETFLGTKELVEEYVDEVEKSVDWVRDVDEDGPGGVNLDEKASFFKSAAKNLGASALCLSGGASFGYYQ